MRKRRRLKRWIRIILWGLLVLLLGGLFYLVLSIGNSNLDKMYEECDNAKGYTCSYYEARLYSIRGE